MNKLVKKLVLITVVCLSVMNFKAQNLSDIKNHNVFFIFFEKGDFTKKITTYIIVEKNKTPRHSYFYYTNKNKSFNSRHPYYFSYSKFQNNRDANNQINETMLYSLNKSFLRKNKNIIITKKFMDKVGVNKIVDLFYGSNKHVFIIDKDEMNGNKILLREVRFSYLAPSFEPTNIKEKN